MRSRNYQDNITMPLSHEYDYDATANNEIDEVDAELDDDANVTGAVLPAIDKLRKIVKAVRSSPQRRQAWSREIQFAQTEEVDDPGISQGTLMLILDVRTRWASTHQMLRTPFQSRLAVFGLQMPSCQGALDWPGSGSVRVRQPWA
jgi:hypothetical protein